MLRWTLTSRATGELLVTFDGEITSNVRFEDLSPGKSRVVLDLAGVRRLNSGGVHKFMTFLSRVAAQGPVIAERCSPAIVMQLGMLPAMARFLTVRSVFLPLECPSCFFETIHLVEIPKTGGRPPLPSVPCPACRTEMELAEPPERYFAFLES